MTRKRLWGADLHEIRVFHAETLEIAERIHALENELVERLDIIDDGRLHVSLGYNSLKGYCVHYLKFTRTQSQRIVTLVRRRDPTFNFGK